MNRRAASVLLISESEDGRDKADALASEADGVIFWDKPLTETRLG